MHFVNDSKAKQHKTVLGRSSERGQANLAPAVSAVSGITGISSGFPREGRVAEFDGVSAAGARAPANTAAVHQDAFFVTLNGLYIQDRRG